MFGIDFISIFINFKGGAHLVFSGTTRPLFHFTIPSSVSGQLSKIIVTHSDLRPCFLNSWCEAWIISPILFLGQVRSIYTYQNPPTSFKVGSVAISNSSSSSDTRILVKPVKIQTAKNIPMVFFIFSSK